jgi:hypothetical protein
MKTVICICSQTKEEVKTKGKPWFSKKENTIEIKPYDLPS